MFGVRGVFVCTDLCSACSRRQPGKRSKCSSVRGNTFEEHGNPVFECVPCSRATKIQYIQYIYIIYIYIFYIYIYIIDGSGIVTMVLITLNGSDYDGLGNLPQAL